MAAFPVSQNFSQSYQHNGFSCHTPNNRSSVDTSSSSGSFDETSSYLQLQVQGTLLIFRNNAGCSLLAYVTEIMVVVVLMSMNFTMVSNAGQLY